MHVATSQKLSRPAISFEIYHVEENQMNDLSIKRATADQVYLENRLKQLNKTISNRQEEELRIRESKRRTAAALEHEHQIKNRMVDKLV